MKKAPPPPAAPRGPSIVDRALARLPERYDFWLVFACAWLVRMIYVVFAWWRGFSFDVVLQGLDQFTYQTQAGYILGGDLLLKKVGLFYYSPIYSYFCAGVYKIFGHPNFWALHLIQTVTGALTCAVGFALARTWLRRPAALLAGAFYALLATWLFYEQELLHEGFMLLFYAVMLWALRTVQLGRPRPRLRLFVAGVFGMLAMIGRGNAALVLLAMVPWIALATPPLRPRWRHNLEGALCFCLGIAVIFAPLLARNRAVAGGWALGMGNGKVLFYIGNNAQANGEFIYSPRFQEAFNKANKEPGVYMRYFLEDVRRAPAHLLKVLLYKTYSFFSTYDLPDNLNFQLGRWANPVAGFSPVQWEWLTPLGLIGLWLAARRRRREMSLLLVFTAVFAASLIMIIPIGRYRQPVLIPLVIFAALAADWALEWWREGRPLGALPAAAVWLGLIVALWPAWHPNQIRPNDYQIGINMALQRHKPEVAQRVVKAALRAYPDDMLLLNNAYMVARARNDRATMRTMADGLLSSRAVAPDVALSIAELDLADGNRDRARMVLQSLVESKIEGGEAIQAQARVLLEKI